MRCCILVFYKNEALEAWPFYSNPRLFYKITAIVHCPNCLSFGGTRAPSQFMNSPFKKSVLNAAVVISAIGYFVDIYDLIIFNVVKKKSLEALGYVGEAFKTQEIFLFNLQMAGMLLGGLLWGILGDKRGRASVLFGSILLYSLANIANAFVPNAEWYGVCRFIAGVGLAGELGAGITLVVESMDKESRGYGTMVIVSLGALGAVAASQIGKVDWKLAYIIGGVMGLLILLLRVASLESHMFKNMKNKEVNQGNFFMLFANWDRFTRYLGCIVIGFPVWFVIGILIALSGRFTYHIGVSGEVSVADCVLYAYLGLSFGDLLSGLFSQWFRNRKKVILGYLISNFILMMVYLFVRDISDTVFYFICFLLGAATGYWALFVTVAAEQFGTNLRSTVTNTVPNFVRGGVIPITLGFKYLSNTFLGDDILAALVVGLICIALATWGTWRVQETFGKDLDYIEE